MRTKLTFILFFSFFFGFFNAQKKDSTVQKFHYTPNFVAGVDVLNGGIAFFSHRKLFQGFISSEVKKDIHALAEAGYEANTYTKNGYDADVKGPFLKLGAFYMMVKDPNNQKNGFYGGAKVAGSFYRQHYYSVPVRGYQGGDQSVSYPQSTQSSYWLEGTLGGRVQLFNSSFYIDVNLQPRYLIFSTKQENIKPMIVPGFGKSSTKFNMGFAWNIAYSF